MGILELWLILWVVKNAAMDLMYASSGKPNPRYEAKKAKAAAAGKNPPAQPRYGTRDWLNDLLADGLQAQTEHRRRKAAAKRQAREQAEQAEQAEPASAGPGQGGTGPQAAAQPVQGAAGNPARPVAKPTPQPVRQPTPPGPTAPGQPGAGQPGVGQPGAGQRGNGTAAPGASGNPARPVAKPVAQPVRRPDQPTTGQAGAEQAGTGETPGSPTPRPGAGEQPNGSVTPVEQAARAAAAPATSVPAAGVSRPGADGAAAAAGKPAPAAGRAGDEEDGEVSPPRDWVAYRAELADAAIDIKHDAGKDCGRPECLSCADEHRRGTYEQYIPQKTTGCPRCGAPVDRVRRFHGSTPERLFQPHCSGGCGWLERGEQPRPQPAPAGLAKTSASGVGGAPDLEQQQTPRPSAPVDEPVAQIIPFRKPQQQEEAVSSTDINAEVIGLDQSIAYAHSLATFAGEHGQAGNEGYIAHLTEAKVEGEALASAAAMQEAFSTAAAAAEAHAAELEKQKAVQEAYDAAPDAGDKDFQQQGR